ncbi:MAG: hypothetical protein U9O64_08670 [Campylobacterota bacterium]|nr:hypothetical protein [Campylobacterota bacterium]
MQEILDKIQNDSVLMLFAIIAFVVFLIIVLVVIVSSMRVRTYKDRFWNSEVDNKEKTRYITELEYELQEYKLKNASNEQLLLQFDETKDTLVDTNKSFLALQETFNALEKEFSQITAKLEGSENLYEMLMSEHKILQEQYKSLQADNSKLNINNARLLMKFESEALREKED